MVRGARRIVGRRLIIINTLMAHGFRAHSRLEHTLHTTPTNYKHHGPLAQVAGGGTGALIVLCA